MSALMTDDKLDELFDAVVPSKPYAYTDISTTCSGITPRLRVFLLPTVRSSTDELFAQAGMAPVEEGNG